MCCELELVGADHVKILGRSENNISLVALTISVTL